MSRIRFKGNKAQGAIHLANNTIVDGDYFTIGSKTYEFDDNAAVTAGRVSITIGGSAALTAAAMVTAINANKPSKPVTAFIDPVNASGQLVRLVADNAGAAGNIALTENVADAGFTVSGATLVGGENSSEQILARGEYTVTAKDVLATNIEIESGLVSPRFVQYTCIGATGGVKANTGLQTVSGTKILIDFAGGTDPIAGDRIVWLAFE